MIAHDLASLAKVSFRTPDVEVIRGLWQRAEGTARVAGSSPVFARFSLGLR